MRDGSGDVLILGSVKVTGVLICDKLVSLSDRKIDKDDFDSIPRDPLLFEEGQAIVGAMTGQDHIVQPGTKEVWPEAERKYGNVYISPRGCLKVGCDGRMVIVEMDVLHYG